ncbi:hypothetical protein ACQYRI_18185 [Salmonella enterica]
MEPAGTATVNEGALTGLAAVSGTDGDLCVNTTPGRCLTRATAPVAAPAPAAMADTGGAESLSSHGYRPAFAARTVAASGSGAPRWPGFINTLSGK